MHDIIFVHIPKNAGSSVVDRIMSSSNPEKYYIVTHQPYMINGLIDFKRIGIRSIPKSLYSNKRILAIVRNPYDRFISCYNYLINGGGKTELDLSYQRSIIGIGLAKLIENLNYWRAKIVHFVPQYLFIVNDKKKILATDIIKFENLKELENKDTIFSNLEHKNISNKKIKLSDLTQRMKDLIYYYYREDFLMFNYNN